MKHTPTALLAALAGLSGPLSGQDLKVDFGTATSPVEAGWQAYTAITNDDASFTNQNFNAFATTVGVDVEWADSPGGQAGARRLIVRTEATPSPALYQDWAGTDTRSATLALANPTSLIISSLPSGSYTFRSHHHDPQNQTGLIDITVNDANGAATTIGFDQSAGGGAGATPAIFETILESNGVDDITVVFDVQNTGTGQPPTTEFLVLNGIELAAIVDPDSDNDGLVDLWEDQHFGNNDGTATPAELLLQDGTGDGFPVPDGDGATNEQEETAGSDPNVADTDGDGLSDGAEINSHDSDPTLVDTDGDGINDGVEINTTGTLPNNPDTDDDGLNDGAEDVNQDDVLDPTETDPNNADTDGDGHDDGYEVANAASGFDPRVDNSGDDPDSDGIPNADELTLGTDPIVADTDGDGILDGEEVNIPSDTDGFLTDPLNADTDNDHQNDGVEVANGTDPTDLASLTRVAELAVDFNSNQDEGGNSNADPDPARGTPNHNEFGYQSYHANHEVSAEFAQANYPAFGTNITLDVAWPNTTDNRVRQSIDRTNQDAAGNVLGSFDANWNGDKINLLTDWIGVDSRTGNGGNGPYDGVTGTPTYMLMDLGGLPAGSYTWRSFHHDTEHMNPQFIMEVSTDGGANFFQIGGVRRVTDSTPAGTPASPLGEFDGSVDPDPANLPSTVNTCFLANGIDRVQFRYTALPTAQVHTAFFVMNGFEIDEFPNDSDDDCFDDDDEIAAFGNLDQGPNDDFDGDSLDNLTEIILGTNPAVADTDVDGLDDGDEITFGTDPSNADTDGDGLRDGEEVNTHSSNPLLADTDLDGYEDGYEVANAMFMGLPAFDVLVDDSFEDPDGDGSDNGEELLDGTDPLDPDSDDDGLNDGDEFSELTDPLDPDSDDDGLTDGDEVNVHSTDPLDPDSDNDGANDAFEVANNPPYDPNVDNSFDDFDNDGLDTITEGLVGTDLLNPDTDGDGLMDGTEWNTTFTDPTLADTDGDGLEDGEEDLNGDGIIDLGETDPTDTDTDDDGYNDGRELMAGTNPDDARQFPLPPAEALFVDFSSNDQAGGPKPQAGYQEYNADHEGDASHTTLPENFIDRTVSFPAFGTSIDFTPSWPAGIARTAKQMIGRSAANDANWNGDQLRLLTDWIGVDTRTSQGGLGDYDGVTGTPTPMLFTLSGLPAGDYDWRSYHHDTENMHAPMTMEVSTDGGVTFAAAITFDITDSTPGGAPDSGNTFDGPINPGSFDPADLPSTVTTSFTATGTDDVVIRWIVLSGGGVHKQFAVVNGFELTEAVTTSTLALTSFVQTGPTTFEIAWVGGDGTNDIQASVDGDPNEDGSGWITIGSGLASPQIIAADPNSTPFQIFRIIEP